MLALRVLPGPGAAPGSAPKTKLFRLFKKLITIGRGADNDIVIADPQLQPSHAYLQVEGELCTVVAVAGDVIVGGRKKSRVKLSRGDIFKLGQTELQLAEESEVKSELPALASPPPSSAGERVRDPAALAAYRKLYEFSERLMHSYELDDLLGALLDAVIEVSAADQGFLVLLDDGGRPRVRLARNRRKESVPDPDEQLSDSIVAKVVRTQQPIIISDALRDAEFQNAQSVMSLRLSSVMCVPLRERGRLLGALYVGSSGVSNLFRQSDLEVLTVLAAQAGLILRNAMLVSHLKSDNQRLGAELEQLRVSAVASIGAGAGASLAMQEVLRTVKKVAGTDVSVLITGETGTGKELIAQEIHRLSPRKSGPMIAINCGAIPEPLLESELFGHVKGAFTGAIASKPGRFQSAHGGTVLLDEIGEMPLGLQVKLLRVLQERVVTRVGDTRAEPVDVRILAATHRDLPAEIRAGRFREDLYYRLNVVQVHLPPLRERGEDVVILARYFMRRFADELQIPPRSLSPAAELALRKHPFPGNIRQLENHIKKALVLSDHEVLLPEDLGLAPGTSTSPAKILPLAEAKERFARQYVSEILTLHSGNRTRTAYALGVDPRTIFRFLEKEADKEPSLESDPDSAAPLPGSGAASFQSSEPAGE
jgi:transcriptional regulator with GAF, ATPase, and Fis domain